MRNLFRLIVLACVSVVALAFAGTAFATFKPRLIIFQGSYKPAGSGGVEIVVDVPKDDDATAKIVIASPAGYSATLSQSPNTQIGTVTATVKANQLAGAPLPLTGKVVVANAADPNIVAAATRCTSVPTHQAVWILNAALAGQTIQIPVYVDQAAGVVQLQVCFASPFVPSSQGGAALGAQLISADFIVFGVFTNPSTRGFHVWSAFLTPWVTGTGTPNAAGTVESRDVVPLPYVLQLKLLSSTKRGVRLGGTLSAGGQAVSGGPIDLYVGTKKTNLKFGGTLAKTNKKGKFTLTRKKVTQKTFFGVVFGPADVTDTFCVGTSPAPGGCVTATWSEVDSNVVAANPPRKKRR
jgi:hypothetical protein